MKQGQILYWVDGEENSHTSVEDAADRSPIDEPVQIASGELVRVPVSIYCGDKLSQLIIDFLSDNIDDQSEDWNTGDLDMDKAAFTKELDSFMDAQIPHPYLWGFKDEKVRTYRYVDGRWTDNFVELDDDGQVL